MQGLHAVDITIEIGGRMILSSVELLVPAGHWVTITGPSGSGKSVLLQALSGLLPIKAGQVLVDGRPAWTGGGDQPAAGIVLQDYGLVPTLSAAETVAVPLQARRAAKGDIEDRVRRWLEALGLGAAAGQLVSNLSGGQRQRVAIARALALEAHLLFLDEPTSELDAVNRAHVLSVVREQVDRGAALVAVSHDPAILDLSDDLAVLSSEGRLTTKQKN
jgi:putative ABC transport system ATP-binding protein